MFIPTTTVWHCHSTILFHSLMFHPLPGKSTALSTFTDFTDKSYTWLDVQGKRDIRMKITSCSLAQIVLAEYRGIHASNAYEVILSGDVNKPSTIKDSIDGAIMASKIIFMLENL